MSSDFTALAAKRRAVMDEIIIDTPRAREAFEKMDYLMAHGRNKPYGGKMCLPIWAKSQSGKSTILDVFAARKNNATDVADRTIPVLVVTLEANATRKSLAQNILEAIGDHGYETGARTGTETILFQRVRALLKLAGTDLLIIDEAHELVSRDSDKIAYAVGETFKRMLTKGVCPIVLSGVERGKDILTNEQLQQRCLPAVSLAPLSAQNPSDLQLLFSFLADYLKALDEKGVVNNATSLLTHDIAACLLEVSQGVLGAVCNLLKEAVRIMTYEGRNDIERAYLVRAADDLFIKTGLYTRNPFREGYAPLKSAA
jgi:hypothetical protein